MQFDQKGAELLVSENNKVSLYSVGSKAVQFLTTISSVHNSARCEALKVHPSNEFFVTGGSDSIIAFYDSDELACSGTISDKDYPIRTLDFSPNGECMAVISVDEESKRYFLDIYGVKQRIPLMGTYSSDYSRTCLAFNPDVRYPIIALGGEKAKDQSPVALYSLEDKTY